MMICPFQVGCQVRTCRKQYDKVMQVYCSCLCYQKRLPSKESVNESQYPRKFQIYFMEGPGVKIKKKPQKNKTRPIHILN